MLGKLAGDIELRPIESTMAERQCGGAEVFCLRRWQSTDLTFAAEPLPAFLGSVASIGALVVNAADRFA